MAISSKPFSLSAFSEIEGRLLNARLAATRSVISHAGEKGKALEVEVMSLLRSFLPAEYGLATGFVAYHGSSGVQLSKQLDIIIFDALRGGPLVSLQTCEVFPIDYVFGYVEVKATLIGGSTGHNSIECILRQNAALREMKERRFYGITGDSPATFESQSFLFLPIRAYVVAFECAAKLSTAAKLGKEIASAARRIGNGHIHGVYAGDSGFAAMRAINPRTDPLSEWHHAYAAKKHAILAFKMNMLRGLAAFPRMPQHLSLDYESYSDVFPSLRKYRPESIADEQALHDLAEVLPR